MTKPGLVKAAAALLFGAMVVAIWFYAKQPGRPKIEYTGVVHEPARHPADVQKYQGGLVVAQLFDDELLVTNAGLDRWSSMPAPSYNLKSPHFLMGSTKHGLILAEGWGEHISVYKDGRWRRLPGPDGKPLRAPHGICVDNGDTLYVADSLNSRLLKTSLPDGGEWEVFADVDLKVSYGRQMVCDEGGVWLSNSYEEREGLNPGVGANILRIDDFPGGKVEVMATFTDSNITGFTRIGGDWLVVGMFRTGQVVLYNLESGERVDLERPGAEFGSPYGMLYDATNSRMYIAFMGDIYNKGHTGGIGVYSVDGG